MIEHLLVTCEDQKILERFVFLEPDKVYLKVREILGITRALPKINVFIHDGDLQEAAEKQGVEGWCRGFYRAGVVHVGKRTDRGTLAHELSHAIFDQLGRPFGRDIDEELATKVGMRV